jgi:hypothetical protein
MKEKEERYRLSMLEKVKCVDNQFSEEQSKKSYVVASIGTDF